MRALADLPIHRRRAMRGLILPLALAGAGLLGGCAAFNQVAVDVTSFGAWPAGRAPGRFAFDRLPSQQAPNALAGQQVVEDAAAGALTALGFQRVDRADAADVLVRVDGRWAQVVDPRFSVGVGIGVGRSYGRVGAGTGYRDPFGRWGWGPPVPTGERREVHLLISDRRSQQVLYEAQAQISVHVAMESLIGPMFEAALQGFPQLPAGERRVVISLADR
jgi:hypothetical protein